ncbi:hypothetical protein [Microbulbifer epialgicus]|uniref:Uncharacterized protein n=1 Tax=Microbulbifer epialgicus TaxID=393907 RepID=A0ABV4NUS0_9GAMM
MESIVSVSLGLINIILVLWAAHAVYEDMFLTRSYEWLVNHYLPGNELREKAPSAALKKIEISGGSSKRTFRNTVMRPMMGDEVKLSGSKEEQSQP